MPETDPEMLASSKNAYLIAAAGYGKTEIIASAIGCSTGRQLVLTHTHVGVDTLRKRLQGKKISSTNYKLETIAGWALRFVSAYPRTSGFIGKKPKSQEDYRLIYVAMAKLMTSQFAKTILAASYRGAFIDEYQDCTKEQHVLIEAVSKIIPCRIVGDPMQAIFGFGGQILVDWDLDIYPNFSKLPELKTAWRWQSKSDEIKNPALGTWLTGVRKSIEAIEPIDLTNIPEGVKWIESDTAKGSMKVIDECYSASKKFEKVLVIHHHANQCHKLAHCLRGIFDSIDEVEGEQTVQFANRLLNCSGNKLGLMLIEFCKICLTGAAKELNGFQSALSKGKKCKPNLSSRQGFADILNQMDGNFDPLQFHDALIKFKELISSAALCRREPWNDMLAALKRNSLYPSESLADSFFEVRQKYRRAGGRRHARIIGRTLLVKGLEYEHVLVVDADKHTKENLYVALTRATRSLTIFSSSQILIPHVPKGNVMASSATVVIPKPREQLHLDF
jgi:hypothetical protein